MPAQPAITTFRQRRLLVSLTSLRIVLTALGIGAAANTIALAGEGSQKPSKLAESLRGLTVNVLSDQQRSDAASMVNADIRRRSDQVNAHSRADWYKIKNRQQWEKYRDVRLEKLRQSLGTFPDPPKKLNVRVTSTVKGDGFQIKNVVYESRHGQWVTANLYVPAKPADSMPGIMIAHAHHRPKRQGEMQDMGMTWARAGCQVLVIDQIGYGERRSHPFNSAEDYAKSYRVSRQDYYFRYDSGVQLQLAGDSLMGWMAWDLMRGVDLLLAQPGTDPKRIILLGAVAGGGDPCGVTVALDKRIAAAVPFNFGGPQPETRYPMPDDAESWFNYLGGSYWESTRGLRRGGSDGFLHWIIVGGIAPRRLIHAHEFSWDQERDPVWKRFQKIYGEFYGVPENLDVAHGKGLLKLRPPAASHCTNIGAYHRRMIHPVFKRWFGINVTPDDEYRQRREYAELACMTPAAKKELSPKSFVTLVSELGAERAAAASKQLAGKSIADRRKQLRRNWSQLLGPIEPKSEPKTRLMEFSGDAIEGVKVERIVFEVEPGIVVPVLLLSPRRHAKLAPVVVALAQAGKAAFLEHRADEIAELVAGGAIVCLPDLRATGETKAGSSRGRGSGDGNRSVNMLLFGETMLGQRLRDLRSVLTALRNRPDVDPKRISLWGDSFAAVNPADVNLDVPRGVSGRPLQSEPLGGLLALFGALFDDQIAAVHVHGGLGSYQSVLATPYVLIPHDAFVPWALRAGDLSDVAAALAPRPLQLAGLVDGQNRRITGKAVQAAYATSQKSYRDAQAESNLSIVGDEASPASWFLRKVKTSR